MRLHSLVALAVLSFSFSAWAEEPAAGDAPAAKPEEAKAPLQLHPRHGEVVLGNNLAKLKVPDSFAYLDPKDTETVLTEVWGNPKGIPTLGMLVPADAQADSEEGWGVVITYDDDGHVSDEDAEGINYDELLGQMRESLNEENKERQKEGYPAVNLVGWATKPHYEKAARKLYWAKELAFGDHPEHTLNYNIRVLGKEGVLNLNAVASMKQVAQVEERMPTVLGFVEFQPGNRYMDFDAKTGRMAAYGIAGLVAGKVALKVGLFKGLIAVLLAAKKALVAGAAALFAALSRLFKRKAPAVESSPVLPPNGGE